MKIYYLILLAGSTNGDVRNTLSGLEPKHPDYDSLKLDSKLSRFYFVQKI